MVFESVVTDVLNKFLGDYVVNLDKKQLKIGIWGGDVVLKNLQLRENALDDLDLPVQLTYGYLGKLVLKIPWKNLYSQPVVAQIEDLYLLISPKQSVPYDDEKEAKYDLEAKQSALLAIDEAYKKELDKDKPKPDATFTEKLTAQIVNNLQVKIAKVHIRYEDTVTTGQPFSFGISLNDLEVYTTDSEWNKCYLTEQVSLVYKIANLDSLSAYMNCKSELFNELDKAGLPDCFRKNIANKDSIAEGYTYVLGPISSIAKLRLNMNPEYNDPPFQQPKIELCLDMDRLNVGLTSTQFIDIIKLAEVMNRMQLGAPYRKYRPFNIPYKNHYKEWWQFAITCILEDIKKKNVGWTWENIKEHRSMCHTYEAKLKDRELSKKPSASLIETCNLLESRLDVFNLMEIRKRVQYEVNHIKMEEEKRVESQPTSWFGGWFSSKKANDENDETSNIAKRLENAMTSEEKDKLYKAIGYQKDAVPLIVPIEYKAISMKFVLVALEFGLYDDSRYCKAKSIQSTPRLFDLKTIVLLKFSMATCYITQRPSANAISVTAGMKEMRLTGLSKTSRSEPPTLIESRISHSDNLLDIFFETNPLDGTHDQRLRLSARPLDIIYHSDTILHMIKVFTPPKSVNLSELEGAATAKMASFKERSVTGMQYAIDNHSTIDIDINFMPSRLIVPYKGIYLQNETSLLVISLGKLCIYSKSNRLQSLQQMISANMNSDEILVKTMENAYDRIYVQIDNIQLVVAKPGENWEDALVINTLFTDMHILRPTSIILNVDLCVVADDPRLPKIRVVIVLPAININMTDDRILEALGLITSLPTPVETTIKPEIEPEYIPLKKSSISGSRLSLNALRKTMVKTSKKEETLSTEIVQYTNLELTFTLKEFNVTIYKYKEMELPVQTPIESPNESIEYSTPVEELPRNNVNLSTEKILSLSILQLETSLYQRTYELVIIAKLGGINLTQHDLNDQFLKNLSIIDTPRFTKNYEYLLTVSYTMANKQSPEFITKYNSTEQSIVVNFTTLNVILHQEYLLNLMGMTNLLVSKVENIIKKDIYSTASETISGGQDALKHKLATIMEENDSNIMALPEKRNRSNTVVDSIKMSVVANLDQVNVLLTCNKRDLASLKVQNFNSGIILKSSYTQVNLRLQNIGVIDLNPQNIHTDILSIVGEDAFHCQVILYNLDETSNYNSDDMNITVNIGCVRIVFLNWFIASILSFLNNFQAAQEALANASAAAAEAAKQNAIDVYDKATRMRLDVKIKAPIIIVPMNSSSTQAVALDLGFINITNTTTEVEVINNEGSPAVIDEIKLKLKDVKLSKVAIIDPLENMKNEENASVIIYTTSFANVDMAYGIKGDINILNPMSFSFIVKRNLSSSWYKEIPDMDISGRLKSVELNLLKDDFAIIMSILSNNLTEGANEFPPPKVHRPTTPRRTNVDSFLENPLKSQSKRSIRPTISEKKKNDEQKKIHEQLTFNFQFDGIVANLMLSETEHLSSFGLYFLSIRGKQLEDNTLSTSIVLCNAQIVDTRSNQKSQIRKYLSRKDWYENKEMNELTTGEVLDACKKERNYMVDVTAIIKENDAFAEVRIFGFDLILCIDYMLQLADFFVLPKTPDKIVQQKQINTEQKTVARFESLQQQQSGFEEQKRLHLILHVEEPDIILVESLEDINTNAIIFNAQAQLNYRTIGERQIINGQIDSLKMYMCSFVPQRREATKHYIIHPCVISLQGSTPEDEGLHVSLKLSEIIINVSPATIELFNKAMHTISASNAEKALVSKKETNYTYIWTAEHFEDRDHWFVKIDSAEEALEIIERSTYPKKKKTEKCIIEVPCITLVIETGIGYYTTPLIAIDTRLNAIISNWSENVKMNGSLSLNMNYYNQALAVWEPIIELNEHSSLNTIEKDYQPWELNFDLSLDSKPSDFDDDTIVNTTNIKIHSEENLEITLSKSCLNTISVITEAFSQAIDSEGLYKPEVIAPYVIENDTGFDVSVNFGRGIFTLHDCHMPQPKAANTYNVSLVLQIESSESNIQPDDIKDCTISDGGRAFLQTKDLSKITNAKDEEYNIYVKVGGIDKEIVLPVSKSDKRYFPLYRDTNADPWGIISEVRSEYGTTKVNIHSIVNISNYFIIPIQLYRIKSSKTMEKVLVGEIPPGEVYHVPLHAIYTDTKDLFFSLEGYHISIQGIKWNDCPTDLSYTRQVQCDPIETYETFYMNTIRQKTEVFYENTNKYKLLSSYYTINLKPPLYLRNALPINIRVSVAGCSVRHDGIKTRTISIASRTSNQEDLLDYGEKEIQPGDCLQLPTVRLSNKYKEIKSYLVVRLIKYLEKDWSCTTEILEDQMELTSWRFSSYDSAAKMDMDLCVRFDDRIGSLLVTLYSPIWMINKTDLMLSYKTDMETVDVLYHPPEYSGPILFSFRDKFFFDKKSASIRVDNGEWSTKIPLDVAGSIGSVTCKANDMSYQIGVHNHLTNNSLTKQITFIPFFIATNKCEFIIELQENSRPGDPWIPVKPNACVPLWPKNDSDMMMVAKVQGHRTMPFNYEEIQCTLLKLENNKYGGINVDVQTTEGAVYITFKEYNPGDAPGLLINYTSQPIIYYEKDDTNKHVLQPNKQILYTWLDPAGEKKIIFGENHVENDLRRDGVGELVLLQNVQAYWVSFLDGLQRVLLFTDNENIVKVTESSSALQTITQSIELSIHGIGLSIVNNETGVDILYLGVTSSGIIWEYKKDNKKRFKAMNIHDTTQVEFLYQAFLLDKQVDDVKSYYLDGKYQLEFEQMTLLKNNVMREIRRTFYPGVWLTMKTSSFQTQLHAKINKIQLDNQLTDCIFPVVLAPISPPKSVATSTCLKPFMECSIVQRVVPNSTVKQFKYAKMLIQEFHIKVDLPFLTAIADMFAGNISDIQAAKLFLMDVQTIVKPLSALVEFHSMQEQKNFYDNLHLGPLKIHLGFSMAGSETTALPGILSTLVQGVGVTLTDVNDVVFRLAFFEREYQFFTQLQLTSEIVTHYTGQALKQLYVLVLGLDVLGNPYGLVVGFKKGVEDLFYEPFQGAIQGPGEFAEGLVLGVKSLFGHTVGGAAGAVSKITGAMGKGLAALTFDDEYQKKRRQLLNRKPANFQEGIARSGKGLVMGFVDGVTGVVTKPVSGAREEGVEGFFKGLGKGAIGLVTRPTAGVVDFASGSLEAVKRAAEASEEANRLRPPRFIYQDNVMRPYCLAEAQGNKLLKEIEKGKYSATDSFIYCKEIIQKRECIIVSNHRVIYTSKNELFGTWTVQWAYLWHEIASIISTDRGVEVTLKKEGKKVMGLFSSHEPQRKVILISKKEHRDKLAEVMESQKNAL